MSAAEAGAASRCALYLRCSTDKQHTDAQRPAVEQLARARGFAVAYVFEETVSAVARHRPAWERLQRGAHLGDFQAVVVFALDRLGRSMIGNVQDVLALDHLGVQVISVREPWLDTGGPVRNLLVAIFSWVAEEERRQISARSRAGVERARRLGKRIGRPPAVVDRGRARQLRAEGLSLRDIARRLGVPRSTLHRVLGAPPRDA